MAWNHHRPRTATSKSTAAVNIAPATTTHALRTATPGIPVLHAKPPSLTRQSRLFPSACPEHSQNASPPGSPPAAGPRAPTSSPCWQRPRPGRPRCSSPPPAAARRCPASCPPSSTSQPTPDPASTPSTSPPSKRSARTSRATCSNPWPTWTCPSPSRPAPATRPRPAAPARRRRRPTSCSPRPRAWLCSSAKPPPPETFGQLRCVVIDEIHALAGTKRGDQLALCLARLKHLAPAARRTGLSATVAYKDMIDAYVGCGGPVRRVEVPDGAPPNSRSASARTVCHGPAAWASPPPQSSWTVSAPPA